MKKLLAVVLFLASGFCILAQEKTNDSLAIGLGLEWNMDSRHNFAGGAAFGVNYNLPGHFAVGLSFTGSNNFTGIIVLEPIVQLRCYLEEKTGYFIQFEAGTFIILEDGEVTPMPEFGLRLGYRQPLGHVLFIEPYGRIGYPFAFGLGLMAGIRF